MSALKEKHNLVVEIDHSTCVQCTRCVTICPVLAIEGELDKPHKIKQDLCTGCGWCVSDCPVDCITFVAPKDGIKNEGRITQSKQLRKQHEIKISNENKKKKELDDNFTHTNYNTIVMKVKNQRMFAGLSKEYGKPKAFLNHSNNFQHLVAILLSAQSTDKMVNIITPELFARAPNPTAMAELSLTTIESYINRIGLYKVKAKYLKTLSQNLIDRHGSRVPKTVEELVVLPGVGRKTAHVYLSNTYNLPLIGVDTHVIRLSKRLDLSNAKTQAAIEKDIKEKVAEEYHSSANFLLVSHGRKYCMAKKPNCIDCPINKQCPKIDVLH